MTKANKNKPALFKLRFYNSTLDRTVVATFFTPIRKRVYMPLVKKWTQQWDCELRLSLSGKRQKKILSGSCWLSSLMMAIEYTRRQIPDGTEHQWTDDNGAESWSVLPKSMPFGWGYPLYRRISTMSDKEELDFVQSMETRRIAYESTMKKT